jgi:HAD superfamily hydrolase (TIGR01450 family)
LLALPLSRLLAAYDNLILDLDGTVWVEDQPTPRAAEAIAAIRAAGKRLVFVTNDGRRTPEEYVQKLWGIGCTAAVEEIISVGSVIQYVLAERLPGQGALVIGSPAIFRHVADSGQRILNFTEEAEQADVVVVVAHDELTYAELRSATRAVIRGAEMICGGLDRNFPAEGGPAPGTGSVVAALEYATGRKARNVGKPDPQVFEVALSRLGAGSTLVIGDHLVSDLGGAHSVGLPAAIVLTGVTDREAALEATDPRPLVVEDDLATLVLGPA